MFISLSFISIVLLLFALPASKTAAAEYIKSVCKLYANSLANRAALVKALSFLSLSSLLCLQSRCDPNSYHRNYCVKFEVCKDEWHRIILCRWIWFSGRILHFNLHTHSLSSSRVCCVVDDAGFLIRLKAWEHLENFLNFHPHVVSLNANPECSACHILSLELPWESGLFSISMRHNSFSMGQDHDCKITNYISPGLYVFLYGNFHIFRLRISRWIFMILISKTDLDARLLSQ